MHDVLSRNASGLAGGMSAQSGGVRDWQCWSPVGAVAWSLGYAALSALWALSGQGCPYATELASGLGGPLGCLPVLRPPRWARGVDQP